MLKNRTCYRENATKYLLQLGTWLMITTTYIVFLNLKV